MAKRKRRTRRATTKKKTTRAKQPPAVSSELLKEIVAIIAVALAVLLLLAIFNIGGSAVNSLFGYLRQGFGYGAYLLPVLLGALAWVLFQPQRFQTRGTTYLGFTGFLLALAALLHVPLDRADAMDLALAGQGGGLAGYGISAVLLNFLNVAASAIVLLAMLFVFTVLAADARLRDIFEAIKSLFIRKKEEVEARSEVSINEPGSVSINTLPIKGALNVGARKAETAKEDYEALTLSTDSDWNPPGLELLEDTSSKPDAGNVKENVKTIQQTLGSFDIKVTMGDVNVGPTVTQYTLKPDSGVKLNKITGLEHNIALNLAAHPIRIEAPIPGQSAVGIEVPNRSQATVRLKELLTSDEMKQQKSPLSFALGRDVAGKPIAADLSKMPHLLVAGATGSGKSIMINTLISGLLYRNSPSDLKLILVDPKRVELTPYNNIPHLLAPVITEPDKCISALKWAVAEMERRYKLFADEGKRNISEYNVAKKEEGMPYIVIIIDELADLMSVSSADVEGLIVRLAQMARATGIHLVLATQRPSVDVITGLIKANIPARIAFSVASQADSRTILDQGGAERLLGKGDMLVLSSEFIKPRRVQGAFMSEKEMNKITSYLKEQQAPQYNDEILNQPVSNRSGGGPMDAPDDDLFEEAAEVVIRSGKGSASLLQRRLRVGYARAARLLDLLEERGIVAPPDGSKPRDVLVSSMADIAGDGEEYVE